MAVLTRHSRRSGNPGPWLCHYRESRPHPVILAAAGIQGPGYAIIARAAPTPSFSPQRESRALVMPLSREPPPPRHSRRSGNPGPWLCHYRESRPHPVILAAAGIQGPGYAIIARAAPTPSFSPQRESRALVMPLSREPPPPRHSRRSGNPEP